jgi:hypothetical protein
LKNQLEGEMRKNDTKSNITKSFEVVFIFISTRCCTVKKGIQINLKLIATELNNLAKFINKISLLHQHKMLTDRNLNEEKRTF